MSLPAGRTQLQPRSVELDGLAALDLAGEGRVGHELVVELDAQHVR